MKGKKTFFPVKKRLDNIPIFEDEKERELEIKGTSIMAFFHGEKYVKSKPTKLHKQWSIELRKVCKSLGFIQKWKSTRWDEDFRLLHKIDEFSAVDIQSVLDWYEIEAKRISEPQILNARHFRNAFRWLQRIKKKGDNAHVEISPKAELVFRDLKYKGWPKGSIDNLPAAIQLTLDNFTKFREKVTLLVKSNPDKIKIGRNRFKIASTEIRFAHYLIKGQALPGSDTLSKMWFDRIHEQIHGWQQWSGNILAMAWNGDLWHKEFRKIAKNWASAYSMDKQLWEKFVMRLNAF
jgi:hypothetical protein